MLRRNDNGKIICDRPDCLCHTDQEQHNILTPDQPCKCNQSDCFECMVGIEDGTAGHSKGNWTKSETIHWSINNQTHHIAMVNFSSRLPEDGGNGEANANLITLAQHAPHDCGDPECPGVINKRKLELYDRFQECIKGFAEAGLLT